MPTVYIIIGDRNTRKSSIIRCLSGKGRSGIYEISIFSSPITQFQNISVYVQTSSLQESKETPTDFINKVNTNNYQILLIALWVNGNRLFPDAYTYVNDFLAAGWNIQFVEVLGQPSLPYNLPIPLGKISFRNRSHIDPSNWTANLIRYKWGWV